MLKKVKKINIGAIDPKEDTFGIITKTKEIVEEAIAQTQSKQNTASISDTLFKSTSQFTGMLLDTASEIIQTEEVEKDLADKLQAAGYTVQQIQGILKAVKGQLEKLAIHSSETIKFGEEDIKKIIAACISIKK